MRGRQMLLTCVVVLICLALLTALVHLSGVAWVSDTALSVSYGPVHIEGCVTSDGTLHVRERRHATFSGTHHGLHWVLEPRYGYCFFASDGDMVVLGAGEYADGAYVPYDPAEASNDPAEAPAGTYTITPEQDVFDQPPRVDVHFERTDDQAEFYVEYAAKNFCYRWQDVGELDWEFVGDNWDADTSDVFLDLYVERSEESGVWEDENVFWWVQTYGTVGEAALEDGELPDWAVPEGDARTLPAAHLAARIDTLRAGRDAEVVAMFPHDWLAGVHQTQMRKRDEIMERETEESAWNEKHEDDKRGPSAADISVFLLVAAFVFCVVAFGVFVGQLRANGIGGGGGSSHHRSD